MSLLNWSNALSMAGGAAAQVGLEGVKATLEEDKIKLADQLATTREITRDERQEKYKVAGEERGLISRAKERQAVVDETVANAPRLREVKVADAVAAHKAQLEFDTDPKNVEAKAKAEAAKAKVLATSAAETTAELLKDPAYLKNLEALTMAQHPEKRAQIAASMASAAASNFELGQKRLIAGAQDDLAKATTPEAKQAAKDRIEALQWSVAADRAQQTADATVLNSLEKSIKESRAEANNPVADEATKARATETANRAQSTYDLLREEYAKNRGLKAPAAPSGSVPKFKTVDEAAKWAADPTNAGARFIGPDGVTREVTGRGATKPAVGAKGILQSPVAAPTRAEQAQAERQADATDRKNLEKLDNQVSAEFDSDVKSLSARELYSKYQNKVDALTGRQWARLQQLKTDYKLD